MTKVFCCVEALPACCNGCPVADAWFIRCTLDGKPCDNEQLPRHCPLLAPDGEGLLRMGDTMMQVVIPP